MDLPTYTNIWRIEKRLYKLYDLRLPMPLPIVWIGVFVGVSAFWWALLYLVGLPFDAPWHVIYLVPPGIVTWLSTRPVIENKRLTELMQSQARYFSEPKTWCRLAPSGEPDVIAFQAKVWRAGTVRVKKPKTVPEPQRATVRPAVAAAAAAATPLVEEIPIRVKPPLTTTAHASQEPARRLIGHPDDKHAAFTDSPEQRRRPASFGQPPRLIRPVSDSPAGPAKDPSRPFATNPLRPAFLAHPSDKPQQKTPETQPRHEAPDASARPAPGSGLRPQAPGMPLRSAAESGPGSPVPDVSARQAPQSEIRPEVPGLPASSAGESVTRFRAPGTSPRPGAEGGRRRRTFDTSTPPAPEAPGLPAHPVPRSAQRSEVPARPVAESGTRAQGDVPAHPAADGRSHAEAPDVPARPVPESTVRPEAPGLSARPVPESTARPEVPGLSARLGSGARSVTPDDPARSAPKSGRPPVDAETVSSQVSRSVVPEVENRSAEPVRAEAQHPEGAGRGARESGVPQPVQEESAAVRRGRHAAAKEPDVAVPPARVEPVAEESPAESVREVAAERPVPAPAQEPEHPVPAPAPEQPAGEEVSSPPIRPDALRRLRRLAASADSAVEPEAPAPSGDWQKERLRKGQPPAPFIPAERGSEATWRRVSQVVAGSDGDNDEDRARTAINGSRRIVVLGCTGGAGQTTTTLLLGHSLARLREDGVVAVDANSGGDGLTGRINPETTETLSSFLTAVDSVGTRVRGYTTRTDSGLDVLAADVDPGAEQRIGDRGWFSDQRIARAMRLLDQQYRIILMDPAAALAARLLPYADQLVLVAPASADAPDSVAMTYDWLDGHGCADLRRRAVVVINGVSRRSMADVERAETVARGRCRAIVRVPWEDELAEPGQVDLNDLRSGGRRAYVALAGVVASGLTTARGESFVG
ncbi:TcpE family conjugal transfer membrane protein [Herbidospora mongoliensis]|uniref:TcpE family conjugal transfer membrane protein n=1 Tax=Herbidospora mongoliensis TaxID=688067 RepID=UPI0008307B8B|nr:TcpE family conjugal transfer membrane protein [Herbidospora mongoliensis]